MSKLQRRAKLSRQYTLYYERGSDNLVSKGVQNDEAINYLKPYTYKASSLKYVYFIDVQETVSSKQEFSASSPFKPVNNT
jgi:hypothetical protein